MTCGARRAPGSVSSLGEHIRTAQRRAERSLHRVRHRVAASRAGIRETRPVARCRLGECMTVGYEVREQIAYLSFNRPEKHNALRDEDIAALVDALGRL